MVAGIFALSGAGAINVFVGSDTIPGGDPPVTCDLNATTSNFSSQVTAATAGQTVCLTQSASYGTFAGTNKAITITAASGATPTMTVDFNTGDQSFTIDGMSGMGGTIVNGANHITIKNSTFTDFLTFDNISANSALLLDGNTHNNINSCDVCNPARIWLAWSSGSDPGITIQNSVFDGGSADGVQAGSPVSIIGNEFANITEGSCGTCHTDSIQFFGATNSVVRGNWIHGGADGFAAYDGTSGNLIEDNVVSSDTSGRCIELYSDGSSTVQHNTTYGDGCSIALDHKAADPAGTGTIIRNNIASGGITMNESTAAISTNNMCPGCSSPNISGTPTFQGGATPSTYSGFHLTAGSAGHLAATDGLDVGIR